MSKVKVYIAGPLSGNVVGNILKATEIAEKLIRNGYSVLCPHLSAFMWYHRTNSRRIEPLQDACGITHEQWLANDLPWVESADVVLRLPGKSPGADIECNHAEKHGIPVAHSIDDLPDPEGVNGDEVVTTTVRYFRKPEYHPYAITRFDGENGIVYGVGGKSCTTTLDITWVERHETEITEAEAVAILGGKRPWEDKK